MKIKRINNYTDERFDQEILRQHGAFLVDDHLKCSFRIIGDHAAIITYDNGIDLDALIDEFRFYTEHITKFHLRDMTLIKDFDKIKTFKLNIKDIQPSQFVVDEDKVNAIATFIGHENDLYIPVAKFGDTYVSCDGHTRLYYACKNNMTSVNAFISDPGDYLDDFAEEARKKGVYSPHNLKIISHADYEVEWHDFCDEFFEKRTHGNENSTD